MTQGWISKYISIVSNYFSQVCKSCLEYLNEIRSPLFPISWKKLLKVIFKFYEPWRKLCWVYTGVCPRNRVKPHIHYHLIRIIFDFHQALLALWTWDRAGTRVKAHSTTCSGLTQSQATSAKVIFWALNLEICVYEERRF